MLLKLPSLDALSDAMRKAGLESTNLIFGMIVLKMANLIKNMILFTKNVTIEKQLSVFINQNAKK